MKQTVKRAAALGLALCLALGLSACGDKESEQVQKLVQGNLDVIYLNKADPEYLELVESSENEAEQDYLDGLEAEAEYFSRYFSIVNTDYNESYDDLSDELKQAIMDLYDEIYSHTKYEVQPAVKQDDGSYTVKVLIDPINIMQLASDAADSYEAFDEINAKYPDQMTDEEWAAYNNEYGMACVDLVRSQMDSLGYLDQKSIVLQYEEDADGYMSINEDDWRKIDEYIIAY